jgi:hypothetical protein
MTNPVFYINNQTIFIQFLTDIAMGARGLEACQEKELFEERGQGLVVLEVMKMENELKSQGIGEVREILVAENDVVVTGQQLIIIE